MAVTRPNRPPARRSAHAPPPHRRAGEAKGGEGRGLQHRGRARGGEGEGKIAGAGGRRGAWVATPRSWRWRWQGGRCFNGGARVDPLRTRGCTGRRHGSGRGLRAVLALRAPPPARAATHLPRRTCCTCRAHLPGTPPPLATSAPPLAALARPPAPATACMRAPPLPGPPAVLAST